MSKKCFSIFLLSTAISGTLLAQQQKDSTARQLEDVVVTATKYPVKQAVTGKVIDIITREQLAKSEGQQLTEVLNTQAGVLVTGAQQTLGSNQNVYIQGADAGKTLILIDGVPAYDPSGISTAFDLNLINIDQVERIEILKGSQSTLYGSDAVAGVINIIMRKGGSRPFNASANLSGGSYGTFKGSAGIDGKVGNTGYNIQYTHLRSDGISSAYDTTGKAHFDNDGFNENIVLANISQQLGEHMRMRANFQYSHYKNDIDGGPYQDDKNYTTWSRDVQAGLGADYNLGVGVLHFNYNYNAVTRNYLDDSAMQIIDGGSYYSARYKGQSHFAELYANVALSSHIDLLGGIDYRNQRMYENGLSVYQDYFNPSQEDISPEQLGSDSSKVNQYAAYASLFLKNIGGFNLGLGGRYNHFNRYGDVFTYSINPSYVVSDRLKLLADLSSGFSAPTLYQLYSIYRDPVGELKPERTVSVEAGAQYTVSAIHVRALYFRRHTRDEIIFSDAGYYVNLDKQDDHGIETEVSVPLGKWSLTGNYTYTTGKVTTQNNGKDTSFYNLYQRPKNLVNLSIGVQATRGLYLSAALRTVGQRITSVYSGVRGQADGFAYYTLGGHAEYRFCRAFKIYADVKNITAQKYFEIPGYSSMGLNFMAGVNLSL